MSKLSLATQYLIFTINCVFTFWHRIIVYRNSKARSSHAGHYAKLSISSSTAPVWQSFNVSLSVWFLFYMANYRRHAMTGHSCQRVHIMLQLDHCVSKLYAACWQVCSVASALSVPRFCWLQKIIALFNLQRCATNLVERLPYPKCLECSHIDWRYCWLAGCNVQLKSLSATFQPFDPILLQTTSATFSWSFIGHVHALKCSEQASAGFGWALRYPSVIELCWIRFSWLWLGIALSISRFQLQSAHLKEFGNVCRLTLMVLHS